MKKKKEKMRRKMRKKRKIVNEEEEAYIYIYMDFLANNRVRIVRSSSCA